MNQQMITTKILDEFGINLPDANVDGFVQHLNDQLEERIGAEITESLTDKQLAELLQLQEAGNDESISTWLTETIGTDELRKIAEDERDILLGELAENADAVTAA